MTDLTGRQIDQYRIEQKLGEGGMGAVYRAHDVQLNRPVAFKVTHSHLAARPAFRRRFLQEAQAAARLDHPSVVKIFDFGTSEGVLYMVMEYVSGGSLGTYIRQMEAQAGAVQLRDTLFVLAQVADALDYAHNQGVVHRDIKPDNVMLKRLPQPERAGEPPLRAVVTDFGLAKLLEGGVETATGTVMGTLAYMSPEQALSQALDGRSDLYSLGVLLYQLVTGRLPFTIRTPTEAVLKHMQETPPPPQAVRPSVPARVAAICERALAKAPADRFQRAGEMAAALREASAGLSAADVTRFAPAETAISLVTRLESGTPPLPSRPGVEMEAGQGTQLVVARRGATPVTYPLVGEQITIGRTAENDVPLPEAAVSRRHARLQQQGIGWEVVDLDSSNGTFLGESRLLPGVAEPWDAGQSLRIGPYYLRWQPAAEGAPAGAESASLANRATEAGGRGYVAEVALRLESATVTVGAGEQVAVAVTLFNQSPMVDEYTVAVEGLPPTWVTLAPTGINLMPGGRQTLTLAVHPPRSSDTTSGRHRFRVTATSTANPEAETAVSGQVEVRPYEAFALEMQPSRLQNGGTARLLVENLGNAPATLSFSGRDPANKIRFTSPTRQLAVAPGSRVGLAVQVRAAKRPLLGSRQQLPFTLKMESAGGATEARSGQLEVAPLLPGWLLPVAGLFLLLCLAAATLGWNALGNQAAEQTRVAESVTGTAVALAALAEREADARATSDFLTAQARGDDDGDGLSNQEERELGSEIDNADTDGDELSDYDEVRRYDTQPTKADTDDDGLADGAEVAAGTLPTNPDTDGDGIPDGLDDEPLAAPGPTATPTLTPSPTPTVAPTPLGGGQGVLTLFDGADLYRVTVAEGQFELLQRDVAEVAGSPAGRQLAFIRGRGLYTMNLDGSNVLHLLPDSEYTFAGPRWSPDGTMIAVEALYSGTCAGSCQPQIGVIDVASGEPTLTILTRPDEVTRHQRPRWSPDGSQIAYLARGGPFVVDLALVDMAGNGRLLLRVEDGAGALAWAPGREIIYGAGFEDTTAVYAYDPAADSGRRLLRGIADTLNWSPDGQRVAFGRIFQGEVAVLDTTRSNQVQLLASGAGLALSAVWSPDGQHVSFVDDTGDSLILYRVRRDGTGLTPIATRAKGEEPEPWPQLGWPP